MYKTIPLLQIPQKEVIRASLVIPSLKPAVSSFPMNSSLLCSSISTSICTLYAFLGQKENVVAKLTQSEWTGQIFKHKCQICCFKTDADNFRIFLNWISDDEELLLEENAKCNQSASALTFLLVTSFRMIDNLSREYSGKLIKRLGASEWPPRSQDIAI